MAEETLTLKRGLKVDVLQTIDVAQIQDVLTSLPYQAKVREDINSMERAEVEFGLAYSRRILNKEILSRLPAKARKKIVRLDYYGNRRTTTVTKVVWSAIKSYKGFIPDQAMVKYKTAMDSGIFQDFQVLEIRQVTKKEYLDPWLVGRIKGQKDAWVVLAYWDDLEAVKAKEK